MLYTENLSFAYPGLSALSYPDIQLKSGENLALLGASGKGKTTFLHLIGGLLKAKTGSIRIGETDICSLSPSRADKFRGRHIGLVFQQTHFIKSLTVKENLLLSQFLAKEKKDVKRAENLLERLGLGEKTNQKPQSLSRGEQQRAALARALMNRPALLLADEPTSALDDENCRKSLELLTEEAKTAGAALLIVTHDSRVNDFVSAKIYL